MQAKHSIFILVWILTNYNTFISYSQTRQPVDEKDYVAIAEKVYLQTDRYFYSSGDDIWFKAYVIDAATNILSINCNNLHVELITPDSKIILNRTIRISKGIGNGDFKLPDSIPSGHYRIRAYTNFMRNFADPFFFHKEISIINAFDNGPDGNKVMKKKENKFDISYFPEGGSLIDNVTSSVAFKAVDEHGKGCDVTISLFASSGELITKFNSTHLGMGSFKIMPIPGFSYYTIVENKAGSQIKAFIPKSFNRGLGIHILETSDKQLIMSVNTNKVTLTSIQGKELTLLISSRNLINITTKIRIDSLVNYFEMPVEILPEGIIRITLSSLDGLPLCERLVFIQKNKSAQLEVTTDKKEYKPREKVTAEISLTGDTSLTKAGYFSFSSTQNYFTDNSSSFPTTITSWFLLESDVHGPIEEPSYYFDPTNKKRIKDLDLLLMTQGWCDFQWKYDTLITFNNESGFTISGSVRKAFNNKPIENAKINLGLFSNNSQMLYNTITDKTGSFKFEQLNIIGKTDAFISSIGKNERNMGRIFIDSVRYIPPETTDSFRVPEEIDLSAKNYSEYQQEVVVKLDLKKKYKLSDTINLGEVIITAKKINSPDEIKIQESRRVYTIPDKELIVTPAVENFAGDVFSFMSGRIAGVRVLRGVNRRDPNFPFDVKIIIRGQVSTDGTSALILLDGVVVRSGNMSDVLALPMTMIDRVDVLMATPAYGMSGANGVVNIITRKGLRRVPYEPTINTASIKITGFDAPRVFYYPKYNSPDIQPFMPDLRTTIFWEPNITIKNKKRVTLNYFDSDKASTINIIVEGITEGGVPLSGKASYEVK